MRTPVLHQPLSSDGVAQETIVSFLGNPRNKHRSEKDLIVRDSSRAILYEMTTTEIFGSTKIDIQSS
jgi:hypothetical protein